MSFDDDLRYSQNPENLKRIQRIITYNYSLLEFRQDQLIKKKGEDTYIKLHDGKEQLIEVKSPRSNTLPKVVLEIYSHDRSGKPDGWTFTLRDGVHLLMHWEDAKKPATGLHVIFDAGPLREWWKANYQLYDEIINRPSYRGGNTWQSSFSYVPITDIPRRYVLFDNLPWDYWRWFS